MSNVLIQRLTWRTTTLIGVESLIIGGIVVLTASVQLGQTGLRLVGSGSGPAKALLVAMVCQLCLYYRDLYELRLGGTPHLFTRVLQSLGAASALFAGIYLAFPQLIISSGVVPACVILLAVVLTGWRFAFDYALNQFGPRERLLIIGNTVEARAFARELRERADQMVEIVGFVDIDGATTASSADIIGTLDDVPAIVRARGVGRVVVSLVDARGRLPMERLVKMRLDGVRFDQLATVSEEYTGKIPVEQLRPSWLIFSPGFQQRRLRIAVKRALDFAGAAAGLALSLPLVAVIAVCVKVTSPGPILYRQRRVGAYGRVFTLRKFRSMRQDAEAGTGAVWARVDDDRVTPIGRVLRKTHLDELPQLWNVLVGDMSLVGPRPERPEFVQTLSAQIPYYDQRHLIKPGVTGWAQISYPYGSSVQDTMEKLQYDLFYLKNSSILLDAYIGFKTLKIIILGRGTC